jgi:hypothetical protein
MANNRPPDRVYPSPRATEAMNAWMALNHRLSGMPPVQYRYGGEGLGAVTVALTLAVVGLLCWPLALVVFPLALRASHKARHSWPIIRTRAMVAVTLAGVELALCVAVAIVDVIAR